MINLLRALFGRPTVISPVDAQQAVGAGAVLIDIRGRDEWRAGHVAEANHIPYEQVEVCLPELPPHGQFIVVCRSGRRAAEAAHILKRHGLHALTLSGGMAGWAAAGLPVVSVGDGPGSVA